MIEIDQLPAVPWKNGGGATRNLAVEPAGAGFDDFVWRVSIADVAQPGAFSVFPGIDRIIVLLSGRGMMLHRTNDAPFALTSPFVPHAFRGEEAIEAKLVDGATRDLNVMVRRGRAEAAVEVWRSDAVLPSDADEAVFVCPCGEFLIGDEVLRARQALRRSRAAASTPLVSRQPGSVLIGALIRRIGGSE